MTSHAGRGTVSYLLGVLLIGGILSCTNPSGPPDAEDVLHRLLARPSLPIPPETALNTALPGYQQTVAACEYVGLFQRYALDSLVESLLRGGTDPIWDGVDLTWIRDVAGSTYILTVTPYDSLRFHYQQFDEGTPVGWYLPGKSSGEIIMNGESLRWSRNSIGSTFEERASKWHTTSMDSLKGGGWLDHTGGLGPIGFPYNNRADWDRLGHGTSDWGSW